MDNKTDITTTNDALYISDFQEGEYFLNRLSLDDPRAAKTQLCRFLNALENPILDNGVIYRLFNDVIEYVMFVSGELGKTYLDQPLPLDRSQADTFHDVIALWDKMAEVAAYCLGAKGSIDFSNDVCRQAEVFYRCIAFTGLSILEYQRVRLEYAPGLWLKLHTYCARAEKAGVDFVMFPHPFEAGQETNCVAAYITVLLCDMADRHRLPPTEQALVFRWAALWAPLVGLCRIRKEGALPTFVLDLTSDKTFVPSENCEPNDKLRWIDTAKLANALRKSEQSLKQRVAPSELGLGENFSIGQCLRLIKRLFLPWSQTKISRKFRRLPTASLQTVRVSTGFEEIFFYVSGKPFPQPEEERRYSHNNFEMQFIFRQESSSEFHVQTSNEAKRFSPDVWKLKDQSLNGLQLINETPKRRIAVNQFLAVTLPGETRPLLGHVVWVMQDREGALTAGVSLLMGAPTAVVVQFVKNEFERVTKRYPGFWFKALPSLGEAESLILPTSVYRPDTRIEFFDENGLLIEQAILRQIIENGRDFDRVGVLVANTNNRETIPDGRSAHGDSGKQNEPGQLEYSYSR